MARENGNGKEPVDDSLKSLIEFAQSVDLEEVVWEVEGRRVAFRREIKPAPAAPAAKPAASDKPAAPSGPDIQYITSPMVGTFWRSPGPDRPPLVLEGDNIDSGERVAVVEAMKVPKDVVSPIKGKIKKILAVNGKAVEYGQKLFEVELV
jgi:acetyl-CoA carboxylase biotin carboxyl carrier protein